MPDIADLLQQTPTQAWWLIPTALALGALHGLEPGHAKTMMAGFIIATRGTVGQAILLGLAATFSHTLVVWAVALGGLYYWQGLAAESVEPYFQILSGAIVILLALWMMLRRLAAHRHSHHHGHHHHHAGHDHTHHHPEQDDDAHAAAHARALREQFPDGRATKGQILMFGLTGGLIPCPAAITVLLLCLQAQAMALGIVLVLGFSLGLALTLVMFGIAAALATRAAIHLGGTAGRHAMLAAIARRGPYLSGLLLMAIGFYLALLGWFGLAG